MTASEGDSREEAAQHWREVHETILHASVRYALWWRLANDDDRE